jgi:hypothetical protein
MGGLAHAAAKSLLDSMFAKKSSCCQGIVVDFKQLICAQDPRLLHFVNRTTDPTGCLCSTGLADEP